MVLTCGEGGSTGVEVITQINENTDEIEAIKAIADVYEFDSHANINNVPDTYTNINNLSIPNLSKGEYLVGVSFTYNLSVTNKRIDYRWSLNGGALEEFGDEPSLSVSDVARSYIFPYTHPADGAFSMVVDIKKEDISGVLDVKFANVWVDKKKELTP